MVDACLDFAFIISNMPNLGLGDRHNPTLIFIYLAAIHNTKQTNMVTVLLRKLGTQNDVFYIELFDYHENTILAR